MAAGHMSAFEQAVCGISLACRVVLDRDIYSPEMSTFTIKRHAWCKHKDVRRPTLLLVLLREQQLAVQLCGKRLCVAFRQLAGLIWIKACATQKYLPPPF